MGGGIERKGETVHPCLRRPPYPTLGEINKRVAANYFSPKIFSNRVRKGLKFFFHLKGRACTPEEQRKDAP